MQSEIVGQLRGEDQRCSLGGQHQTRFLSAEVIGGYNGVQGFRPGWTNDGQRDDDDRFGISERRRRVEAQVEGIGGR